MDSGRITGYSDVTRLGKVCRQPALSVVSAKNFVRPEPGSAFGWLTFEPD
jgi:hypothetical protein